MVLTVVKSGDSLAIPLPVEAIELLGLREGSEVDVAFDEPAGQVRLAHPLTDAAGLDAAFAQQLDAFIAHYRPALVALAR
jgi:antitoxin component of MazEF toxin-antitoxin module